MDEEDQGRQASEALATVRAHQERTRRAARLPWWVYVAMFVLTAAGTAASDFVSLTGAKLMAVLIIVVLVVVLVTSFVSRSALFSRVRGVQLRQQFVPRVFGVVLVVAVLGAWLISRYGTGFVSHVANAVGLRNYPNTVAGILWGAAFTALFALSQLLIRRTSR
jgi:flagellar biosynthesis protein FliQ